MSLHQLLENRESKRRLTVLDKLDLFIAGLPELEREAALTVLKDPDEFKRPEVIELFQEAFSYEVTSDLITAWRKKNNVSR